MTQQVKKKLNDSWGMRWGALAIVAFTITVRKRSGMDQ